MSNGWADPFLAQTQGPKTMTTNCQTVKAVRLKYRKGEAGDRMGSYCLPLRRVVLSIPPVRQPKSRQATLGLERLYLVNTVSFHYLTEAVANE